MKSLDQISLDQISRLLQQSGTLFLVLIGSDLVSKKSEKVILSYVEHRARPDKPLNFKKVFVDEEAAKQLRITMVPQIRLYQDGKELHRHRGFVSYTVLQDLVSLL